MSGEIVSINWRNVGEKDILLLNVSQLRKWGQLRKGFLHLRKTKGTILRFSINSHFWRNWPNMSLLEKCLQFQSVCSTLLSCVVRSNSSEDQQLLSQKVGDKCFPREFSLSCPNIRRIDSQQQTWQQSGDWHSNY